MNFFNLDMLERSHKCVHTGVGSSAIVRIFYPCNSLNPDCLFGKTKV